MVVKYGMSAHAICWQPTIQLIFGLIAFFVPLSVAIWIFVEMLSNPRSSFRVIELWNAGIQGATFSLVALGAYIIRKAFERKRNANQLLKQANEELRRIPHMLIAAQEKERQRLAAELHDSIGQTLAALKFRIEHILLISMQEGAEETVRLSKEFIPVLQRSIEETRSIYMGLRPHILEDVGAIAALIWYRNEMINLYPELHIEMDVGIEESEIPNDLMVPIFRIGQEALNNICRLYSR